MNTTPETRIFNELIASHLDACFFYRDAAGRAEFPQAERSLYCLEKLHSDIVADLGLAAHKSGLAAAEEGHGAFATLRHSVVLPPGPALVGAVETAEELCAEELRMAIESEDVSPDLKMHVLSAAQAMQKRHEPIQELKTLVGTPVMKEPIEIREPLA